MYRSMCVRLLYWPPMLQARLLCEHAIEPGTRRQADGAIYIFRDMFVKSMPVNLAMDV